MTTISMLGQELKIIKGIGQTPGDANSAEQSVEVLDLLAGAKGFSVEPGGWIPNLPQIKNSGLWADSSLTDGRTLVAAAAGNITENITLTSHAATLQGRYYWEKELMRFGRLCADFWQMFNQIEPVYLKWWAPDAPGPQYALLYKIEIAQRGDPFSGDTVQELTVSVEREPYWRGIAPGANPKLWTFEARHEHYTLADLDLSENSTRNLAADTLENRREWNTTTSAEISSNALDIPGTDIPGDVPALVCISMTQSIAETLGGYRVYLARSTKPTSMRVRTTNPVQSAIGTGATVPQFNILNAADGALGTDATLTADANAPAGNKSASGQRVTVSFATATMQDRVLFSISLNNETSIDANTFRGRYAVFMRARTSAAGTVNVQLLAQTSAGNDSYLLPAVTAQQGVGATPSWYLHYMGVLPIPFWQRAVVNRNGLGLNVTVREQSNLDFTLQIQAERTSGACSLYIADLILMPMDEFFCYVEGNGYPIIDNTGYFGHGVESHVGGYGTSNILFPDGFHNVELFTDSMQPVGQLPMLEPGVNNRLYYLAMSSAKGSPIAMNTNIKVNIVPRWSGVRDV